jgi:hypothetical protein
MRRSGVRFPEAAHTLTGRFSLFHPSVLRLAGDSVEGDLVAEAAELVEGVSSGSLGVAAGEAVHVIVARLASECGDQVRLTAIGVHGLLVSQALPCLSRQLSQCSPRRAR